MIITPYSTYHLIKSQDLNHHGTLYAGRCADWFVESGFIAACSLAKPEHIVCLKIHGLLFSKPAHLGDILPVKFPFLEEFLDEDTTITR